MDDGGHTVDGSEILHHLVDGQNPIVIPWNLQCFIVPTGLPTGAGFRWPIHSMGNCPRRQPMSASDDTSAEARSTEVDGFVRCCYDKLFFAGGSLPTKNDVGYGIPSGKLT